MLNSLGCARPTLTLSREGWLRVCSLSAALSHVSLLGELDLSKALAGTHHVLVLDAHDTTAPLLEHLGVVAVHFLEGNLELLKVLEIFLAALGKSNTGGGLHVAELAEVDLAADDTVGDVLSTAERG